MPRVSPGPLLSPSHLGYRPSNILEESISTRLTLPYHILTVSKVLPQSALLQLHDVLRLGNTQQLFGLVTVILNRIIRLMSPSLCPSEAWNSSSWRTPPWRGRRCFPWRLEEFYTSRLLGPSIFPRLSSVPDLVLILPLYVLFFQNFARPHHQTRTLTLTASYNFLSPEYNSVPPQYITDDNDNHDTANLYN